MKYSLIFSLRVLSITCMCFTDLISLWIIGEIIRLLAVYIIIIFYNETSVSDLIQYLFIIFIISIILLFRIITDSITLFYLRLWRKLRLTPLHQPVLNMASKLNNEVILYFFIIPKLAYLLICYHVPTLLFGFSALGLLLFSRKYNSNEPVRIVLIVSTLTLSIIFSISSLIGYIIFIRTVIWRVIFQVVNTMISPHSQSGSFILLLGSLLPVPRRYSWIVKTILTQTTFLPIRVTTRIIVVSTLPIWYIFFMRIKHSGKYYVVNSVFSLYKYISIVFIIMITFVVIV